MRALEKLLSFLVPTLRIPPRWRTMWDQGEVAAFLVGARIFFGLFAVVYVLHFYLVDIPLKKEPLSTWAFYRFSCATAAAVGLALSFSKPLTRSNFVRLPLMLTGIYFGYMQAQSMTWRAEIPYVYAVILPAVAAIAMRSSVFASLAYLTCSFVFEYQGWASRPQELPYLASAAMVALMAVATIRSRMSSDVSAFLAEQAQLESQKKIIEKELELNEQIRSFLPKVIYDRFESQLKNQRQTVLQAIDEVLRGHKAIVACIYTDIRNVTSRSKTVGPFIVDSVVPNMRACTDLVEAYDGVPRLIGDLIFAYFDTTPAIVSLKNAVRCAIEIADKNVELNSSLPSDERITRHVIVSFGEAYVGNTGGSEGSREITAIGRPANLVARIDSITKDPALQEDLRTPSIILSESAAGALAEISTNFQLRPIDLKALKITIRDFPEETNLYLLPLSDHNRRVAFDERFAEGVRAA